MRNEVIRDYIVQAQKTWRKHKAAMILATQSIKELQESGHAAHRRRELPNEDLPRQSRRWTVRSYREAFHLNDTEIDLIAGLVPPGQMVIRKARVVEEGASERRFRHALDGCRTTPTDNLCGANTSRAMASLTGCASSPTNFPSSRANPLAHSPSSPKEQQHEQQIHLHRRTRPALARMGASAQDASARTVQYHSQDIIPIHAKLKYTTLIELPATEKIMEAATGDKDFWIVDVVGNFCFVHPAKAGISSNLNLITDKGNIYSSRLQDVSAASHGPPPDLKVIVVPADRSSIVASTGPPQFVPAAQLEQSQQALAAVQSHIYRSRR